MIEIKNCSYVYPSNNENKVAAFDQLNLEIREGEFIVIMGHNSSGKTTLARCLNGLLIPQTGQILIDQLPTNDENNILKIRKMLGMVFQNPDNQLVATTVEREVAFGLENLSVPSEMIHSVVAAILDKFHLAKYRKYPPYLLSGGEKQRVALASVLAMNPKYLVLDEPTSMLDPKSRKELLKLIFEIKHDNKEKKTTDQITIILITQFPEEAIGADRLIMLEKGKIIFDDKPEIVFQNIDKIRKIGLEVPIEYEILPLLIEKGYSSHLLDDFK